MIHLPAALVGEFPGLSMSHARRLIAHGMVTLNGRVVTDLDVDLDTILEANQEAIDRENTP